VTNPVGSINAVVGWQNPLPVQASLAPALVSAGAFTVTIQGSGFVPGAWVVLNGTPVTPLSVTSSTVTFQSTLTNAGSATVVVVNPNPGSAASHPLTLKVAQVTVKVSPTSATLRLGTTQVFSAVVANAADPGVHWSVDGQPGGSAATGFIDESGRFTPPAQLPPTTNVVVVRATSVANGSVSAQASVTLQQAMPVIQAVVPPVLNHGLQTITFSGTGFAPGAQVTCSGTNVPTQYSSSTLLTATLEVAPNPAGVLGFRIANPAPGPITSALRVVPVEAAAPGVSYRAAARFLEQASWGPSAASIAHLQEIGFAAWLDEQFAAPISLYVPSSDSSNNLGPMQNEFFVHAMTGPDQLRQRVAFALGQIFVVSALKTGQPRQMVPYQNLLLTDAFGPYATLLEDVTLSPTMGVYLDLVYNDKANPMTGLAPNENYAREVLQLFSVGTSLLNPDGSEPLDPLGRPLPAYEESVISEMARAFTGWTFPGPALVAGHNPESYVGPLIPVEINHDAGAKVVIQGVALPAGQGARPDLEAALAAAATHPNVGPFLAVRLIRNLVTSQPSPAYVARVSEAFVQSQGNLGQVVRAILLDPEARQGDDPGAAELPDGGHLREPILYVLSVLRALDGRVLNPQPVRALGQVMGQNLFYAPSVFNYYSPLYRLPGGQPAPEFQLVSSATALIRANSVYEMVTKKLGGGVDFDLTPFTTLAGSPTDLVEAVDHALLYGRLPAELKPVIAQAVGATSDPLMRARNAIYLVATSPLYQVQH
jgi:uncharacterized protein (DUF1800 family)